MADAQPDFAEISQLTGLQRRVLGVLVEKGFTTPDAYPLTLKSLTTGCNQKSNRSPVTNYDEDDVLQAIDEMRGLGLVAVVHTESGRTERYRHYMRQRFPFSETQLAVITELLLRGRQTLGELRARAARMIAIDSLETLRDEVRRLMEMGYVQATGPLERRGVEVDHNFYEPAERRKSSRATTASAPPPAVAESTASPGPPQLLQQVNSLQAEVRELRAENGEIRDKLATVQDQLQQLSDRFSRLRRELGD